MTWATATLRQSEPTYLLSVGVHTNSEKKIMEKKKKTKMKWNNALITLMTLITIKYIICLN